jgi:hypothetical protein
MGSGYKPFTAASVLTSADMNNYLMEQSVMFFATTAARDAAITAPEDGMVAYIGSNDANEGLYTYNGTTWRKGPGWNAPWGMQAYFVDTVNGRTFTTAAVIPNITGSVPVVNNRYYRCTFQCRFLVNVANVTCNFTIRAGGAAVATGIQKNISIFDDQTLVVVGIYKATANTTLTFDVTASANSNTGSIYGLNSPTFLAIEDCGPYGAPV